FEAIANALPHLPESSLEQIGGGAPAPSGTKVVLGPGTGIGVAGLVLTGDGWRAVGGEGGHVSVAVEDDFESDLLAFLRRQLGHVSYESLVSGPGLVRLAHAIADMTDIPFADWSGEQVSTPADVTRLATAEPGGPAGQAVAVFARLLGGFAGDLALILGALGGVYVAGGVVSHLGGQFDRAGFRQRFEAKGRFADYLAAIPAYLITEENPGLLGLSTMLSPGD
ncbi:MAG: glucokinase, partial [Alphaproteobacteria bacterium]|nr:glucokinase [Alphaproteobacteria bacterium]